MLDGIHVDMDRLKKGEVKYVLYSIESIAQLADHDCQTAWVPRCMLLYLVDSRETLPNLLNSMAITFKDGVILGQYLRPALCPCFCPVAALWLTSLPQAPTLAQQRAPTSPTA